MPGPPLYFVHIPRSGGTTATYWIANRLPADHVYPFRSGTDQLAQKMFPSSLSELPPSARARIRFYAPHLPLCLNELIGQDLRLAALVRDPVEQLRSVLSLQGITMTTTLELSDVDGASMPWYLSHQLRWYLGTDTADVLSAFAAVAKHGPAGLGRPLDDAMADVSNGRDLVDRACSRLETLDILDLTQSADRFTQRIAEALEVEAPGAGLHLNQGPGSGTAPRGSTDLARLLESERQIYEHAVTLVESRLS